MENPDYPTRTSHCHFALQLQSQCIYGLSSPKLLSSQTRCSFLVEWNLFLTWRVDFLVTFYIEVKLTIQCRRKWLLLVLMVLCWTELLKSCHIFACDHLGKFSRRRKMREMSKEIYQLLVMNLMKRRSHQSLMVECQRIKLKGKACHHLYPLGKIMLIQERNMVRLLLNLNGMAYLLGMMLNMIFPVKT